MVLSDVKTAFTCTPALRKFPKFLHHIAVRRILNVTTKSLTSTYIKSSSIPEGHKSTTISCHLALFCVAASSASPQVTGQLTYGGHDSLVLGSFWPTRFPFTRWCPWRDNLRDTSPFIHLQHTVHGQVIGICLDCRRTKQPGKKKKQ